MERNEFLREFESAAERRLGADFRRSLSIAEIREKLGLRVNPETLRLLLRTDKAPVIPAPRTQRRIREDLANADQESSGRALGAGFQTCGMIRTFVEHDSPGFFYNQDEQPDGRPELVVSLGFPGGPKMMIRCLDDAPNEDEGNSISQAEIDRHLQRHVQESETLSRDKYVSILLLTNYDPSLGLKESLTNGWVRVLTVSEYIAQFFDIERYNSHISTQLRARGLDHHERICEVRFRIQQPTTVSYDAVESEREDCLAWIWRQIISTESVKCLVLGSFGQGKTSLCLLAADDLLQESRLSRRLPLPVIVEARQLASPRDLLRSIADSIRQGYGNSLPDRMIIDLIHRGELVIFVDSLEESPGCTSPASIYELVTSLPTGSAQNDRSKFFLMVRPEIFDNNNVEDLAVGESITRVYLKGVTAESARLALDSRIGPDKANRILPREPLASALLHVANPLRDLIRTPLFLDLLCQIDLDTDLLRPGRFKGDGQESMLLFSVYDAYVKQWAERERKKEWAREIRLEDEERISFCKSLATAIFNDAFSQGTLSVSRLEELVEHQYPAHNRGAISSAMLLKFRIDAMLSMLLVRDADATGGTFRFLHESIYEFLLASVLVDEIESRRFDHLSTRRITDALDATKSSPLDATTLLGAFVYAGLRARNIERKMDGRNPSEGVSQLEDSLRFLATNDPGARSDVIQTPVVVENLIYLLVSCNRVSNRATSISLAGLSLPFADLAKMVEVSAPQSTGMDANVTSSSTNLEVTISADAANTEFVRIPSDVVSDKRRLNIHLERPQLPAVSDWQIGPNDIFPRNADYRALVKDFTGNVAALRQQSHEQRLVKSDVAPLTDWVVVQGGAWKVGRYIQDSKTASAALHKERQFLPLRVWPEGTPVYSRRKGCQDIFLSSFAIQKWPVTNEQFFYFLLANPEWHPDVQRAVTRNDYYLLGWDMYFSRCSNIVDWFELDKKLDGESQQEWRRWLKSPVVYVNWEAASAFANYYGWSLPSEAQFEAASRLYQEPNAIDGEAGPSGHLHAWNRGEVVEDPADFPWSRDLDAGDLGNWQCDSRTRYVDDFAVYQRSETKRPPIIPIWDCTAPSDSCGTLPGYEKGIPMFQKWADLHDRDVPYHMIGLVREWMTDTWAPQWPLASPRYKRGDYFLDPVNDGVEVDVHDNLVRPMKRPENTEQDFDPRDFKVLRGGSYTMTFDKCRISYRDAQRKRNVNPDAGFRCIAPLWPSGMPSKFDSRDYAQAYVN